MGKPQTQIPDLRNVEVACSADEIEREKEGYGYL